MADEGYVWDEDKRAKVWEQHQVSLSETVQACEDPDSLLVDDPQDNFGRFMMVGATETRRVLQVICSDEEMPVVRLITAFDANETWTLSYQEREYE